MERNDISRNKFNLSETNNNIKSEFNLFCSPTTLLYDNYNDLVIVGDEKGRISFYDLRVNKAVKLINHCLNEIKYYYYLILFI